MPLRKLLAVCRDHLDRGYDRSHDVTDQHDAGNDDNQDGRQRYHDADIDRRIQLRVVLLHLCLADPDHLVKKRDQAADIFLRLVQIDILRILRAGSLQIQDLRRRLMYLLMDRDHLIHQGGKLRGNSGTVGVIQPLAQVAGRIIRAAGKLGIKAKSRA